MSSICFLTSRSKSFAANFFIASSPSPDIFLKFSMGNLESTGIIPPEVFIAASTFSPDLKVYWRLKDSLGKNCFKSSFKTCSPIFPLSFGELKNACRSFIPRPISENSPIFFCTPEITLAALSSLSLRFRVDSESVRVKFLFCSSSLVFVVRRYSRSSSDGFCASFSSVSFLLMKTATITRAANTIIRIMIGSISFRLF